MRGVCGSPFPRWGCFLYYTSSVFEMEPSLTSRKPMEGALPRKGHVAWPDERQLQTHRLRGGSKIRKPTAPSERGPRLVGRGFGGAKENSGDIPFHKTHKTSGVCHPRHPIPSCLLGSWQPASRPPCVQVFCLSLKTLLALFLSLLIAKPDSY